MSGTEPRIIEIVKEMPEFDAYLERLIEIANLSFVNDPLNLAGLGVSYQEGPEIWSLYYRTQFEIAFAGAATVLGLFVGELCISRLVGFAIWYGTGKEFLGDNIQLRHWETFVERLNPKLTKWWAEEMIPRYIKLTDHGLGKDTKKELLHLQVLGVHPDFQRQGLGSILVRNMLDRGDSDGVATSLESDDSTNHPFYKRLGYEIKFQVLMPSPHGDFTTWCFCRETSKARTD